MSINIILKQKNAFLTSKDNFPVKLTKEKVVSHKILRRIGYKSLKTNVRISKNAKKNQKNMQKMVFFDKKLHF